MNTELKQVTDTMLDAERRGDVATMERIMTDDFVAVGPRGFVLNKSAYLQGHKTHELQYQEIKQDELTDHVYGDAAIITKKQSNKATFQGHDASGEFRVTQFFVKQGGDWRLASTQLSPIMGPIVPMQQK
jgi:ketosteroid isomerase-like protein